uniref:Cytoskeleton associated protein 2-like n=1 Tax=Gasterosteus aculeatus aculeatus TaxID=481459 RepID=A0AAQ4Q1F4_GASAC
MEEKEIVTKVSRKELRKQKLMEYLSAKGKWKPPNPKPYLRADCLVKKPVPSALEVVSDKENKVPADRFTHESTKIQTQKRFSDSRKVSVSANNLTGRHGAKQPSTTGGSAQRCQNHLPTRTATALSSGSNPTAASHLQKRPNTGAKNGHPIPSSGRASSNASGAAATKSNSRLNSSSKASWPRPMTAVSVRMSLGPMVKTKTGLVPAAIQPSDVQRHRNFTHTSATAADTTTKKMQSSTRASVSVSQKFTVTQSKPLRTTSLNNNQGAKVKVQNQGKCNSKPLLSRASRPPSKIPPSSGPRSTAAPLKPQGGGAAAAGRPAGRSTTHTSAITGQKERQPSQVAPQTSSRPASGCGSRAAGGAEKNRTCGGTDAERGRGSAMGPPAQTGSRRTGALGVSQTVPRPNRPISHTGHATNTKTPKVPVRVVPQTEGRKVTAAQEDRVRKLHEWREARGISYKRPPMPVKPQVRRTVAVAEPFWGSMSEEDEARSLIGAVDRSLADCIKLLEEGFPTDQVREVLSRLPPVSRKFAKYWICRARLMERDGHLDVLPVFEEAVGVVLEPLDELRTVVFQILKKRDEIKASAEGEEEEDATPACESGPERIRNPTTPPRPARALICGERGDSSVVKYKITSTPGFHGL